jgi:TolB-like protein/Flp pilus assembly protein TadD
VQGEKVDHRSDIFSLGVVLYEMITGHLPFKGDYDAAVVYSIINEVPNMLDKYRSDITDGFQVIIDRALEKDRESRYQHVDALLADLEKTKIGSKPGISKEDYPSIAVMPFADMSPEKDQEYFCDGIAEEIINALTHVGNLRVVARTSAFSFKGKDVDIREIGRKLNVGVLLEGSVRKAGTRLRVTAQLVNVFDGYHIWSERYDREFEDVFAVQDEISLAVVSNLKVKLLGREKAKLVKRYTENIEAYNLYLMGRYNWSKRTEEGIEKAFEYYNRAIEKDPLYAIAYTGISDSYNMLGFTGLLPSREAFTRAKAAAKKALEIDDSLAEAHSSLAFALVCYDWEWERAEREFTRAIELNRDYALAHYWYGSSYLMLMGRLDEALSEMKRAQELDPLSPMINWGIGAYFVVVRQNDKAIEIFKKMLAAEANIIVAHVALAWAYFDKKMYDEAFGEHIDLLRLFGEKEKVIAALRNVYSKSGYKAAMHRLYEMTTTKLASPISMARNCARLGEKKEAFDWLEKALNEREAGAVMLKVDPAFVDMRSDPRFTELLSRIGLPK